MSLSLPRLTAVVLLAVAASACGGGAPPAPSNNATLRGTVHVIPTGPPIAGVSVATQGRSTVSGADGTFVFEGLTVGETTVSLTKDGYVRNEIRLTLAAGTNTFSLGMEAVR